MRPRPILALPVLFAMLALAAVAAGCGSGDDTSSTAAAATTATTAGGQTVTIEMGEFFYKPADAQAPAGSVTIDASNTGNAPHELVLAKTDADPADLPTASDGSVDEEKLDSPGEIPEVEAGADGSATLDLKPGNYVMFCNLPGHYKSGMYGTFTVK